MPWLFYVIKLDMIKFQKNVQKKADKKVFVNMNVYWCSSLFLNL